MGDVTEFKPRPPKNEEGDYLVCIDCNNATWIMYSNGDMECPVCGTWTNIIDESD